jgi:colicin import membrane protein
VGAAALPAHDTLLPRPPGGNGPGAALALLVHLGLILALTTVVDWRARTPETMSAELWAAVPQVAAPPPPVPQVTPPPPPAPAPRAEATPPREADIALEKARERKAEQERRLAKEVEEAERKRLAQQKADEKRKLAEEDKRKQEADRKKLAEAQKLQREKEALEAKAEEARAAQQREANLRRMMGQAGGSAGSTGTAAQNAGPSGTYAGKLIGAIRRNIVFTGNLSGNPVATVEVTAAPGGSIISRRLIKSSGYKDWDEAVLRAVERTGSLPRDTDGRVPSPVTIDFNFRD